MILEMREYKREELLTMFNTTRLDAIKHKIQRAGYNYTESGRGKSYTMTVTAEPPPLQVFSEYCQKELHFAPQTDYEKLSEFLYYFLTIPNFPSLQYNEMIESLEAHGVFISRPTLKKYCDVLLDADFYSYSYNDYVYSVFDVELQHNRYITEEEYTSFWREYFKITADAEPESKQYTMYRLCEARNYGKPPKKRAAAALNGIYTPLYNKALDLIKRIRACGNVDTQSI